MYSRLINKLKHAYYNYRILNENISITQIPTEYLTYDICFDYVKKTAISLIHVPLKYRTYDLCMEAIKQDGCLLIYVPEEHRTLEMCINAIKENGLAVKLHDLDIYKYAETILIAENRPHDCYSLAKAIVEEGFEYITDITLQARLEDVHPGLATSYFILATKYPEMEPVDLIEKARASMLVADDVSHELPVLDVTY